MEKVKYIPGDLIKSDRIPDSIWKIEEVLQDKYWGALYRCVDARNDICCTDLYKHQIVPVPLTSEILKKNEWKEVGLDVFEHPDNSLIEVCPYSVQCSEVYYDNELLLEFDYVHQLQHLLFGLGLNHEMEV